MTGQRVKADRTPFQVFAEFGGKQHALAERKKRHRGQFDAFPEMAGNEDPTGDERYTPREVVDWALAKVGITAFDLDVAACLEAHLAERYYTKADNGLIKPWFPKGVRWTWCNPPYSDIEPWPARAWQQVAECAPVDGGAVLLLPATKTEQKWWHSLIEPWRDQPIERDGVRLRTHFTPGRTSFARPGSNGVAQSGSPFGCVLLIFRRHARG